MSEFVPLHDLPIAAFPLKSYRARGPFGWIMIGAETIEDAWREAKRSTAEPYGLQYWDGSQYRDS